jgi:hypothetical protein
MRLDQRAFEKWKDWIQKIQSDLEEIINNQAMFLRFRDIISENGDWIDAHHGGAFCHLVFYCYTIQAITGIRRHVKDDQESVSFIRLLRQIRDCAHQFTYEFYLTQHPQKVGKSDWQKITFQKLSSNGVHVDKKILEADIAETQKINNAIEKYADKIVSHLDKRGFQGKVTYSDLKTSIDNFNKLACKYILVLSGHGYRTLEATFQENWEEIFEYPFIDPRKQ